MNKSNIESIKQLRKELRLTQFQMAELLEISERNYREKEKGNLPFTQTELMVILTIFNLDHDVFFNIFFKNSFKSSFWLNNLARPIILEKCKNIL